MTEPASKHRSSSPFRKMHRTESPSASWQPTPPAETLVWGKRNIPCSANGCPPKNHDDRSGEGDEPIGNGLRHYPLLGSLLRPRISTRPASTAPAEQHHTVPGTTRPSATRSEPPPRHE